MEESLSISIIRYASSNEDCYSVLSEPHAHKISDTPSFGNKLIESTRNINDPDIKKKSWEEALNQIREKIGDFEYLEDLSYVIEVPTSNGQYTGQIESNKRCGLGILNFSESKSAYYGNWKNDLPNGIGYLYYAKNHYYLGNFVNGKFNGSGKYQNDSYIYEGHWKKDKQQGKGKEINIHGEVYKGMFFKGKKNGNGNLIFDKGKISGYFVDGKIVHGIFKSKDEEIRYKGFWKNGMWHGKGKLSSSLKNDQISKMKGRFKKGVFSSGEITLRNNIVITARTLCYDGNYILQVEN
ncbi:hypothetical protein SteCoe_37767 [Stentor coeruleus]|uniref:MORN repeat protein n=1 Tax=Stentor coeruleus TaxID=5963 RepID=A0A1R2AMG1_9CILI|nr:hypothetical protein SteCoe_37767 [Stentor coeruleus]